MNRSRVDERTQREREHWAALSGDPDVVFGWASPAGRLRAERRAALVADAARLGPGVRALEVGCGTGLFTEKWARSGADLLAIDLSPDLLARARQRVLPATARVIERRFEDLAEGSFDAVIGSSVLHHLDVPRALEQLRSLLVPGGRLAFAEPNMRNPQVFAMLNVPGLRPLMAATPDETAFFSGAIARALRRAGFVDVRVRPFDWLHPATPSAAIPLVRRVGAALERVPIVRGFAGSLLLSARAPG